MILRAAAVAFLAVLAALPVPAPGQDAPVAAEDRAEPAVMQQRLQRAVDGALAGIGAELAEIEMLLLETPEDRDLLALQAELRAERARLEVLDERLKVMAKDGRHDAP